jgi:hypothetical protein
VPAQHSTAQHLNTNTLGRLQYNIEDRSVGTKYVMLINSCTRLLSVLTSQFLM